jgi:hypothetical protein
VGTNDFHISFTITTRSTVAAAVLNQRPTCDSATMWDVRIAAQGQLQVETADSGAQYTSFYTTKTVNDGNPHMVTIARTSGTLTATVDGVLAGSGPSDAAFGVLSALMTGSDVCDGVDGTVPLVGTVTDVCITPR